MRIDKFLKVSRIIKRRPVAKLVLDNKNVTIDGKVVKAGTKVKEGNVLEIKYYSKSIKVKILEVPTGNVTKDKASDLVQIISMTDIKNIDDLDKD